ncbi:MAG TPA: right-handed parallel beta-helix repeat-containing protein [Longimicrobium sp.]|nr:right-handed parallel beta-helix repeat-containing protein [Longimicrobium sp.]
MRTEPGSRGRWGWRLPLAGAVCLLSACGGDSPLPTEGARVRPPGAPSRLLNPACDPAGTTHAGGTISTAVTWAAAGSPHVVLGTVTLATGGTLTIQPGATVCLGSSVGLHSTGGRLVARGLDTARILFTAHDLAQPWDGIHLQGTPPSGSQVRNARVEHVAPYSTAIAADDHVLFVDSTVVRQAGAGVRIGGRHGRFADSRVDTTTNPGVPAATLGDSARFEDFVVRGAAGTGMLIDGTSNVRVLGGRIEGSGGVGIRAPHETGVVSVKNVRVVGGQGYPIETTPPMLQRLYGSNAANQDSLKGNARDTVVMLGGVLHHPLTVRAGLPWRVTAELVIGAGGELLAEPGSAMVMDSAGAITALADARLRLRGTAASPVVLTAADPAVGWLGILLASIPSAPSYITSARVEHVAADRPAVNDAGWHPVRIDSVVFRRTGQAVRLWAAGSRLTRSRVDTTLALHLAAVELGGNAILESTLIRGAAQGGVSIHDAAVQVQSCEVRESGMYGIWLFENAPVHDCNLVDNGWGGLYVVFGTLTADATGNWWGDPGGPTAPGANGVTGSANYTPWRTTPVVLPYVP